MTKNKKKTLKEALIASLESSNPIPFQEYKLKFKPLISKNYET